MMSDVFSSETTGASTSNKNRRQSRSAPLFLSIAALLVCSTAFADDTTPSDAPVHHSPDLMNWLSSGVQKNPMEATRLHATVATDGLSDDQTGPDVQAKQKQVVSGLDAMIKELEDEQRKKKQGNGGSNPNPQKPMTKSVLAKGPGGSGPLHDSRGGIGAMGKLDEKQRDQIQQSQTQGFPPGYDSVLANYYARLAQEQSPSDGKTADPKATDAKTAPAGPPAPASPPTSH
jgi:hypothetical protein